MTKFIAILAVLIALAGNAWAASQTVTLAVPDMTCSACPLTVKAALTKVDGVTKVEASLENKEAVVTFDDAKTSIAALTKATANAGYPSSVKH
jgi:mercuric ion binding protein